MPRNIQSMFAYEAKRRPDLAKLVADIDILSEEDIQAAKVPLPWIRTELLKLKRASMTKVLAASLESHLIDGQMVDPVGEMRRWEGANAYVKIGRCQLELSQGQLIWVNATGIWIDTIHTTVIDPRLAQQTVGCGLVTRSEYMAAVRTRMRQLHPEIANDQPVTAAERFRFYRPG